MTPHTTHAPFRILVIDDNTSIHQDFIKILMKPPSPGGGLPRMEADLFGTEIRDTRSTVFEVDCATQGREGVEMVQNAQSRGCPYALAFVDGRMPPGWDGVETISRLWQASPELQVVLCTAYSDYSWKEIQHVLGENDNLLILKKPFDNVEVLQLGHALTRKWMLNRELQGRIQDLGNTVQKKTQETNHMGALLQAALEHSPSGIIISDDKDGKTLWANPAALRILENGHPFFSRQPGMDPDGDWQVFRPDGIPYALNELPFARAMLEGEIIRNEEFIIRNARGDERWISSNAAPVRDPDGAILAVILVVQDISERILAQNEREKLQAQLIQAQKMESLGVLTGGVTHDFNNLLQVIGGNIELFMIENQADTREAAEFSRLHNVVKSIDRASQLVRQLLLFSRKAEVKKQRVDVNHEVTDTVKMLKRVIPKNIFVELSMAPSVWPIHADPTQFEQVLLNLGGNAVDAMPCGGRLNISTQNLMLDDGFDGDSLDFKPGAYVLLTLSDTGFGMDSETLKHAFDPFFTTKAVGRGTGLGLASVYGILKSHGGFIHCSSEPGHGTTFKVYWPVMLIEDTDEATAIGAGCQGGTETLLVVDDEPSIREMITEILQPFGYTVLTAADGDEALDMYQRKDMSIDMVILDLNMPGMDGYQCLRKLVHQDPSARVLVASGYSSLGETNELV